MSNRYPLKEALGRTDCRHVLGLSGGKDSAALAVYIKETYPQIHDRMEYFFSDTGSELKEVYEFLDKLEAYLGKEIIRLSSGRDFKHWLKIHNDFLPSPRQRWCTRVMKIEPFEKWLGETAAISYVGIRADENREGYVSTKETIKAVFPFIEDGLRIEDIFRLLQDSVGIPEYYKWRSRSGCYFCFFQRQDEWLGLSRNHPLLFEEAKAIEREAGAGYTWVKGKNLDQVVEHAEVREKEGKLIIRSKEVARVGWVNVLAEDERADDDQACIICTL